MTEISFEKRITLLRDAVHNKYPGALYRATYGDHVEVLFHDQVMSLSYDMDEVEVLLGEPLLLDQTQDALSLVDRIMKGEDVSYQELVKLRGVVRPSYYWGDKVESIFTHHHDVLIKPYRALTGSVSVPEAEMCVLEKEGVSSIGLVAAEYRDLQIQLEGLLVSSGSRIFSVYQQVLEAVKAVVVVLGEVDQVVLTSAAVAAISARAKMEWKFYAAWQRILSGAAGRSE